MIEHHALESCRDYLPKPKRKYSAVLVQCRFCERIYRGSPLGYGWIPVNGRPLIKGENK